MPAPSRAGTHFALLLLVAGLVGSPGCDRAVPADEPLDLAATGTPPCPAHATCWSFPAQEDGWTVGGAATRDASGLGVAPTDGPARLTSPPLRARGRTALAIRLRAAVDLRVTWAPTNGAARPLSQWKRPQPWWIDRWHAVELPQDETGRITIEGIGTPGGQPASAAFSVSAAELLRDGRGRCHRDDWVGIGPPVTVRDAVVCIPPAQARLTLPAETDAIRIVAANGPEGGRGRVEVFAAAAAAHEALDDAVIAQVEPVVPLAWSETRAALPKATAPRPLRIATRALAGGGTVAFAVEPIVTRQARPRPNVVLYLVDTLRADALDLSAPDTSRTPNFAALAARGTVFADVLAPAPWTLPTVVSLFTGRDPTRHGVVTGQEMLPPDVETLATRFRAAGHRTAAFSTNPYVSSRHGMHRGFEAFGRVFAPGGPHGVENGMTSALVSDFAVPWIRAHADEPFFLYLHVMDPHQPYTPRLPAEDLAARLGLALADPRWPLVRFPSEGRSPAAWSDLDRMAPAQAGEIVAGSRQLYAETVVGCDREFGRLWQAIEAAGLADDTVVVVTADHGEEFLEHGLTGHGHALYDELLRVPLLVAHPTLIPRTRRVAAPVSLTELSPWLLHVAGVGESGAVPRLSTLLGAASDAAEPLDAAGPDVVAVLYAPGSAEKMLVSEALTTPRWKLIRNHPLARGAPGRSPPSWELYDRDEDPGEQRNVADENPQVVRDLAARLARHTAAGPAPTRDAGRLDQATRDRLRALGYAVD
jgi:arylsulfatase A-like enzyme